MSLINDMLQKLDRRQQRSGVADDLIPQAHRGGTGKLPASARVAMVIAAALLLGVAAFALERLWPRSVPPAPERVAIDVPPAQPPRVEPAEEQPTESPAVTELDLEPVTVPDTGTTTETAAQMDTETADTTDIQRIMRTTTPRERADDAYNEAVRQLSAGRRARAEAGLEEALGHDAAHHDARAALAGLYLSEGRMREAETLLQEGLRISPSHAPFADQYARILMRRGDLAGAIGVLERSAPSIEDDPEYHALAAYLHQQAGNHDTAAGIYRTLVDVRADRGQWWLGLGISLEALRQPERALSAYDRARGDPRLGSEVIRFLDERIRVLSASEG